MDDAEGCHGIRATEMLQAHRDKLDNLTNALLMHEELDTEEVDRLFAGVPLADLKKEPPKPEPTPVPEPVVTAEETPTPEPPGKPGLAFG